MMSIHQLSTYKDVSLFSSRGKHQCNSRIVFYMIFKLNELSIAIARIYTYIPIAGSCSYTSHTASSHQYKKIYIIMHFTLKPFLKCRDMAIFQFIWSSFPLSRHLVSIRSVHYYFCPLHHTRNNPQRLLLQLQ